MRKIQENPRNCPVTRTGGYIGGKWKPIILVLLMDGIIRFGKLSFFLSTMMMVLTQKQREQVEYFRMLHPGCTESHPLIVFKIVFNFDDNVKTLISVMQTMCNRGQYFKEVA